MNRFRIRYPEFQAVDDVNVAAAIVDAQSMVDVGVWESLYWQGVFALAAHLLCMTGALDSEAESGSGAPRRAITSESVGALKVTYADNPGLNGEFGSYGMSTYGQRFLELKKLVGVHVLVVR